MFDIDIGISFDNSNNRESNVNIGISTGTSCRIILKRHMNYGQCFPHTVINLHEFLFRNRLG